jgi:hypothetical protein
MKQISTEKDYGLLHEFFILDPTGDREFSSAREAEKYADAWLANNHAMLNALTQGKTETLDNGVMRRYYKIYGNYIQ